MPRQRRSGHDGFMNSLWVATYTTFVFECFAAEIWRPWQLHQGRIPGSPAQAQACGCWLHVRGVRTRRGM